MDGWWSGTWLRPTAIALALASIALVIVNGALTLRIQNAQAVLTQRQQFINQAVQVSRVAQLLVQTIAKTALATKDDALTALLERHGVRLQPGAPAEGAPPEAPK
ncbi:MAG TPA: hypothetical protein VFA22_11505 [Stellaceae bacterium]|nr:hypothetical protein [Stellaceae bacterium]